jgi:hypothetical protein
MSETFTFTGAQVQQLVSGCDLLQRRLRAQLLRVPGVSEEADEKRAAIRALQAEVDAIIEKLVALPGKRS